MYRLEILRFEVAREVFFFGVVVEFIRIIPPQDSGILHESTWSVGRNYVEMRNRNRSLSRARGPGVKHAPYEKR